MISTQYHIAKSCCFMHMKENPKRQKFRQTLGDPFLVAIVRKASLTSRPVRTSENRAAEWIITVNHWPNSEANLPRAEQFNERAYIVAGLPASAMKDVVKRWVSQ